MDCPDDFIFFFGCLKEPGHHLFSPSGHLLRDNECDRFGIPRSYHLDGGPLFLPKEELGAGALTFLPARPMTILAWWGNPFDGRPGVNNAILGYGKLSANGCWNKFREEFKNHQKLMELLQPPKSVKE